MLRHIHSLTNEYVRYIFPLIKHKPTDMLVSELFREVNEWRTAETSGRNERGDT
jgi:hypothetical protein